jgi:hypothetical protein
VTLSKPNHDHRRKATTIRSTTCRDQQRTLAAYHEAGHAIARLWRGLPPAPLVEIWNDGSGLTHGTGHLLPRWDAFGIAVVTLAGDVAEHLSEGRPYAWDDEGLVAGDLPEDSGDFAQVLQLVEDYAVIPEHAADQAVLALTLYWPVVEQTARRLLDHGFVPGGWIAARYAKHVAE